jgi:hypothetical protein
LSRRILRLYLFPLALFAVLKGIIANMFIRPPKVTELGNETMLNFGLSLLEQKSTFTFPEAKNIKESRIVDTEHIQK